MLHRAPAAFLRLLARDFQDLQIEQMLFSDPQIRFLLVLNEPNLMDQANMSPQAAATLWPPAASTS